MGQTAYQALEVGSYTVLAADVTAGEADITLRNTPTGGVVQIKRAGVVVTGDAVITFETENLNVADGASTLNLTADDVIEYIVY